MDTRLVVFQSWKKIHCFYEKVDRIRFFLNQIKNYDIL